MRRFWLISLVVALAVLITVPALAEHNLGGFIRIKGWVSNYAINSAGNIEDRGVLSDDAKTSNYVEERSRLKFTLKGNEYVSGIAYFEIDSQFGGAAYSTGRNLGGGLENDVTNLETKDLFFMFTVPDTDLKVKAGIFNATDSYAGTIFGVADMAGIAATYKIDPVNLKFMWAKWQENSFTTADDVDFYALEGEFSPAENFKMGINFYFLNDQGGKERGGAFPGGLTGLAEQAARADSFLTGGTTYTANSVDVTYDGVKSYWIGIDGSYKFDVATVSGFFFYNSGKIDNVGVTYTDDVGTKSIPADDLDIKAFVFDLRADAKLGPGSGFIEGIYVSGTDENDTDYKAPLTASDYQLAGTFFYRMDTQILFPNGDDINTSEALAYDIANKGAGLIAVAAGYKVKFTDSLSGKIGVGYLADGEKAAYLREGRKADRSEASAIEVNAKVNYNITKGLDVGLYGAYASLSDWTDYSGGTVDPAALVTKDADDLYSVYARLQFAF